MKGPTQLIGSTDLPAHGCQRPDRAFRALCERPVTLYARFDHVVADAGVSTGASTRTEGIFDGDGDAWEAMRWVGCGGARGMLREAALAGFYM